MDIIIGGTVAVGKTTLFEAIKNEISKDSSLQKLKIIFEGEKAEEQNPIIEFFYQNRPEWSFLIQSDFLLERFKSSVIFENFKKDIRIFDRHFLDNFIWMQLPTISDDMSFFQINLYKTLNDYLLSKFSKNDKPDFYFLIKDKYSTIIDNLKKRGRKEELIVDQQYWKDLYKIYYEDKIVLEYLKNNTKNFKIINLEEITIIESSKIIINLIKQYI